MEGRIWNQCKLWRLQKGLRIENVTVTVTRQCHALGRSTCNKAVVGGCGGCLGVGAVKEDETGDAGPDLR
jgi:hypothetical protein